MLVNIIEMCSLMDKMGQNGTKLIIAVSLFWNDIIHPIKFNFTAVNTAENCKLFWTNDIFNDPVLSLKWT